MRWWGGWLQLIALFSLILQPLTTVRAVYVPDAAGNPVWLHVNETEPEPSTGPDWTPDGNGIPQWMSGYQWATDAGLIAWWGGGNYLVSGNWVSFPSQYHLASAGDRDFDGIPDDIDPFPDDASNQTFWWGGGTFTIDNSSRSFQGAYFAGAWQDSDNDGIPDVVDPYQNDANNGNSTNNNTDFYWGGGTFTINNSSYYFNSGMYLGYWSDSDGDGIPDTLDPYPYDSNNGNSSPPTFTWAGGTFLIDGAAYTFSNATYNGEFSDSDGDGIPDCLDPYPNDAFNNTAWWQGGTFLINGSNVTFAGQYHRANAGDADTDGIPDDLDPYQNDVTNNTFWWDGGTFKVDGHDVTFWPQYYAGTAADADQDGIPDALDAYAHDAGNNTSRWEGGYFLVNGEWSYYPAQYYAGGPLDTDGDGIPDLLDPYPNDPWNNTYFAWNGGTFLIDGAQITFGQASYGGLWNDRDGDGIPDVVDPYLDDPNNNTAWWAGGTFMIDGNWTTLPGQNHRADAQDADQDNIPDDIDPRPNDGSNNSFYWAGGSFMVDNSTVYFNAQYYPGDGVDTDGDGIPDVLDLYPGDSNNGNTTTEFWWNGGTFTINNASTTFNPGFYSGTWSDSDGDSIPDVVDPYPFDPNNNDTSFYWGGGYFTINNEQTYFASAWYPGTWLDSDGDNIPDVVDPYIYDPNNGNTGTWWPGTTCYVDGTAVTIPGRYYFVWVDSDADGIPDFADPYPSDPNNNSAWWNGTSYLIDGNWVWLGERYHRADAGDSDVDGLPDDIDPYPNDPNNGNYYTWPGQTSTLPINNQQVTFYPTVYAAPWMDSDGDGIPNVADPYPDDGTNNNDTDNDGIPDRVELQYGLNPNDSSDALIVRADGLTNLQAYQAGLSLDAPPMDPNLDTDGDGMPDVYEIINGLDRFTRADAAMAPQGDFVFNVEKALGGVPGSTVVTDPIQYHQLTGHAPGGLAINEWRSVAENDWDGDGISNIDELLVFHTDPRSHSSKPNQEQIRQALFEGKCSLTTRSNFFWMFLDPSETGTNSASAIETLMSVKNPPPTRLGNGGAIVLTPPYSIASPGGGGAGPQTDPDHDGSNPPPPGSDEVPPVLTVKDGSYIDLETNTYVYVPTTAHLDWTISQTSVIGVDVQRRAGVGGWATIVRGDSATTEYEDGDRLANVSYAYRVVAKLENGKTVTSNVVTFIVPFITGGLAQSDVVEDQNPGFESFLGSPRRHFLIETIEGSATLTSTGADRSGTTSTSGGQITLTLDPYTRVTTEGGHASCHTQWWTSDDGGSFDESANPDPISGRLRTTRDSGGDDGGNSPLLGPLQWILPGVNVTETKAETTRTRETSIHSTSQNGGGSETSTLSNEYSANQFFTDTLNQFPGYSDWAYLPGAFPYGSRYRSKDDDDVSVTRTRYKFTLNPSAPVTVKVYDIMSPEPPSNLSDDEWLAWWNNPPSQRIVASHDVTGGSNTESAVFEIDPTVTPDRFRPGAMPGYYFSIRGLSTFVEGFVRDTTDGNSGATPAILTSSDDQNSGAAILRPPDGNGKNGLTGLFSAGGPALPGATWTIHISNSADFTIWNGTNIVHDGQTFSADGESFYYSLGFTIVPNATAGNAEQVHITISEDIPGGNLGTELITFTNILPAGTASGKEYTIPFEEASGSRYRKIGLNGRPLADEKPQQTAESDEEKEETYVDALTLGLHHSTTDVYVPIPGSDLTLSARRDTLSEGWNLKSGLRPHEHFDRPFGAGWSSNLCVHEEMVTSSDGSAYTYVVDQNGARHRFALVGHDGGARSYVPLPSDSRENGDYLTTLSADGSVFTDRYGTQINFDLSHQVTQNIAGDRVSGGGGTVTVSYGVSSIVDRFGNALTYHYPSGANTLIPMTVVTNQGLTLSIEQDTVGHITRLWDPNGNQYTYTYNTVGSETVLTSVRGPDGHVTQYEYGVAVEEDQTPADLNNNQPTDKYHLDITRITDAKGNAYTFGYGFDQTRFDYNTQDGYFQETGGPSCVATVDLPADWGRTTFSKGDSRVALSPQLDSQGQMTMASDSLREAIVTDAAGNHIRYSWSGAQVFTVGELVSTGPPPKVVFYTSMNIAYAGYGTESFTFDPTAGLALSSVTDISGNTTHYIYGDHYSPPANDIYHLVFPWAGFATAYPDPTAQIDALGHSKLFHYGTQYRIMDSVTDEAGRSKVYQLDTLGRRLAEYVVDSGGATVQETDFGYDDAGFPGVVTSQTVRNFGGPAWASDLVTQKQLDAHGRVVTEVIDPGGLALATGYTYDLNGNKRGVIDPLGNATAFEYDARNRLTKAVYADGSAKSITYEANGNKSSETDENGHVTSFGYDALNRLTSQTRTMASGNISTSYSYSDAVRPKTSITDANGHTTSMEYDGLMRLTRSVDALGHATAYDYSGGNSGAHAFDSSGFKPTSITDARGYTTGISYDSLYRATGKSVQYQLSPALFSSTSTGYDNVGNALSVTDPLLHTTTTDYDALNRPVHVTNADGTETRAFYTSTGLKWKVRDELGNESETQYDAAGRAVAAFGPMADDGLNPEESDRTAHQTRAVTQSLHDAASNVVATINPLGQRWDYVYDARIRKIEEHQPAVLDGITGQVQRPAIYTGYDYVGNVLWVQDARGFTSETAYDEANRPLTITAPPVLLAGGTAPVRPVTHKTYDLAGNVLTVTDANTHVTTNTYDDVNRLATTIDAANIEVDYAYDAVGNRTSVKDGLNQETTFLYDGLNRNTRATDATGHSTLFAYNALNKVSRTDALGQLTQYGYDTRNRLTSVSYANRTEENRTYSYNLAGDLLAVTEPGQNGVADVAYTYDALHRVVTETSNGATHGYRYDLAGNRLGVQYGLIGGGNGRRIESTYDALNRLSTLSDSTSATASTPLVTVYDYDLGGNVVSKTLPNQDAVVYHYDSMGRAYEEEGVSHQGVLYYYLSLCDAVGNLQSSFEYTANLPLRTVAMDYDAIDRLTTESVTDSNGTVTSDTSYAYDAANNRTQKTAAGVTTTYSFNSTNELTGWTDTQGRSATYGYDSNGNRLTRSASGATDSYTYDAENRLVGLTKNTTDQPTTSPGSYSYQYDYRTRRVSRTESGSSTQMVFSGGTSVAEYNYQPSTIHYQLSAEYVRGSDWGGGVGGILYTMRGGTASFDHYDRRGDVTARTDSNGAVTWQASYEAFGTRTQEQGSTQDRQKANTKEEDPTGLLNEGMRYRDLETGTFITRDPAGFVDGPNLYAYVRQNPWTKFDAEGLFLLDLVPASIRSSVAQTFPGLAQMDHSVDVAVATAAVYQTARSQGSNVATASYVAGGYAAGDYTGALGVHDGISGDRITANCQGSTGIQSLSDWERAKSFAMGMVQMTLTALSIKSMASGGSGESPATTEPASPPTQAPEPPPLPEGTSARVASAEAQSSMRPEVKTSLPDRVTKELASGERRTPAENAQARNFFERNRDVAKSWWEERNGKAWPEDATHAEHPRSIKEGGDPLYIEPGFEGPNAPHMKKGPDGISDFQRWGREGGRPRKNE